MKDKPAMEDLINLLKPLTKDATSIIAKSAKEPQDSHLKSHFGGQPWFEKGEQWPKDKNGKKLGFVFQVYNQDDIAMPKNIKLLQFYMDLDNHPWKTKDDGWLVKIYEKINLDNFEYIERPEKEINYINYCNIKFENIKTLPGWDMVIGDIDTMASAINKDEPWEVYYEAAEKLIGEPKTKTQLGGYPYCLQSDFSVDDERPLLFQLDSLESEVKGINFSDCGMAYVFYNIETKKIDFICQCC